MILLAIDICGPTGWVALARVEEGSLVLLGEVEVPSRNAATTLLPALRDLLASYSIMLNQLTALLVVDGPGSFTGVRIGLSAAKGLSEALGIPIATISRLEVLAARGGTEASALDAHRDEIFLRLAARESAPRELLADGALLESLHEPARRIAIVEPCVAEILQATWPDAELIQTMPPTAADALRVALPRILAGEFSDALLLDGNYLRRSDAEIFAKPKSRTDPQSTKP